MAKLCKLIATSSDSGNTVTVVQRHDHLTLNWRRCGADFSQFKASSFVTGAVLNLMHEKVVICVHANNGATLM